MSFKFEECVDCQNKFDDDICDECESGELFEEIYVELNFGENSYG